MAVKTTVINPPPTPEPSLFDQMYYSLKDLIANYWGFLLFLLAGGIVIYLVYTIRKWDKEKNKTTYQKISDKIEALCLMQSNSKRIQTNTVLMWGLVGITSFMVYMLTVVIFGFLGLFIGGLFAFTIFLVGGMIQRIANPFTKRDIIYLRYREDGIMKERYIGDYGGEYYSSDGYLNLLVFKGRKKLIFRNKIIIRVPQSVKAFYDVEQLEKRLGKKDSDDKKILKTLDTINKEYSGFIKDLVQFNESTIVINHAKSLDKFKFMYYPVFVDERGQIIDKGVKYYKGLKEQSVLEALYDQTDEYSRAQIKAIQINPRVQYKQATGDEVIDDTDDDEENK